MAKPASGTALNTGGALYSGLANWWGFLEGSGSSVADGLGGNTGTLDATVTWTTDADGPLLAFSDNTVFQPIAISQIIPSLHGTNNWTLAWRGKTTTNGDNSMVWGDPNNVSGHLNYVWMRGSNYLRCNGFAGASQDTADFTDITSFTTQHDYVLTGDFVVSVHNFIHLYVDGVESAVSPVSVAPGFESIITIGGGFPNLSLIGSMSYAGLWINRALSASEALTLHNDPYGTMYGSSTPTTLEWLGNSVYRRPHTPSIMY